MQFVNNCNCPETHGVYRDWRKIVGSYSPERLLLGETWVPDAQRLADYSGYNDELQLGFNFPFAFAGFDPARLATIVGQTVGQDPDAVGQLAGRRLHQPGRDAVAAPGGSADRHRGQPADEPGSVLSLCRRFTASSLTG